MLPATLQKFKKISTELYEQLYVNKLYSLDKMEEFQETHKQPKPT